MGVHPDEDGREQGEDVGLDEGHQDLEHHDEEREQPSDTGIIAMPKNVLTVAISGMSRSRAVMTMWPASMFAKSRIMSAKGFVNMPSDLDGDHDGQEPGGQPGGTRSREVVDDSVLRDARVLLGDERDRGQGQRHREVAGGGGGERHEAQERRHQDEEEEAAEQRA